MAFLLANRKDLNASARERERGKRRRWRMKRRRASEQTRSIVPDRAQGDYVCEVRRREAARYAGEQTTPPPIRVAFLLANRKDLNASARERERGKRRRWRMKRRRASEQTRSIVPDRAQGDYVCEVRRREAARYVGLQTTPPPIRVAFCLPRGDFVAKKVAFVSLVKKIHFVGDFFVFFY